MRKAIYIMGVSGSGKTTIGRHLSKELALPFFDADDFHPPANVSKMSKGIPLNDQDRAEWLMDIQLFVKEKLETTSLIMACSALKEKYRKTLDEQGSIPTEWIFLQGSYQTINKRMQNRKGHYMPPTLLQSQFDDLEIPLYAYQANINLSEHEITKNIIRYLSRKNMTEFGLIGLGVMGKSLSRNLARNGFKVSLYNRFVRGKEEKVAAQFISAHSELRYCLPFEDLGAFVASLAQPRKIFLMVNAGPAVDQVLDQITPLLDSGDVIVDGGNSHYKDTERRVGQLKNKGILFLGSGVSGGEKGALEGPSIMPGGSQEGYQIIHPFLEKIAAIDPDGSPCCTFIGHGGAGHFVKMIHNGIEYAEMQLIAEMFCILRYSLKRSVDDISELFKIWNEGSCKSYLLEITGKLLQKKEGEQYLIDLILDKAGNKGTGSWTTIAAAEYGIPIPSITAALFARFVSFFRDTRNQFSSVYGKDIPTFRIDHTKLSDLYQLCRIVNHHQGFHLMAAASEKHQWDINFSELCRIWTDGCIIRSTFMQKLAEKINPEGNILALEFVRHFIDKNQDEISETYKRVISSRLYLPCLSASINYFLGMTQTMPSAHIIQAQRDYFGAHTYERIDDLSGKKHHTEWE